MSKFTREDVEGLRNRQRNISFGRAAFLDDLADRIEAELEKAEEAEAMIGGRLEVALNAWGQGIMAFQEAMAETGIVGTTYPAIRRYLNNVVEPKVSFLVEAAEILGVSFLWLATGTRQTETVDQPPAGG